MKLKDQLQLVKFGDTASITVQTGRKTDEGKYIWTSYREGDKLPSIVEVYCVPYDGNYYLCSDIVDFLISDYENTCEKLNNKYNTNYNSCALITFHDLSDGSILSFNYSTKACIKCKSFVCRANTMCYSCRLEL